MCPKQGKEHPGDVRFIAVADFTLLKVVVQTVATQKNQKTLQVQFSAANQELVQEAANQELVQFCNVSLNCPQEHEDGKSVYMFFFFLPIHEYLRS